MYKVTKEIEFCYGHRLLNHDGKCRFLHGHNARVEVEMAAERLDGQGMVADFHDIKKALQGWIDQAIDHKMLLHESDPAAKLLESSQEPIVRLKTNPTAEAIAKLIFDQAKTLGFPVTSVRLWETPTSFATYQTG